MKIPCEMCQGKGVSPYSGRTCETCSGTGDIGETGGTILAGGGSMSPPPGMHGTIDDPDTGGP